MCVLQYNVVCFYALRYIITMAVGVADEQCNLLILVRYFTLWLRRHRRVQEIANFHEKLASKEQIARLRRTFAYWRHCILSLIYTCRT